MNKWDIVWDMKGDQDLKEIISHAHGHAMSHARVIMYMIYFHRDFPECAI